MRIRGLLVDATGCLIRPREPVGDTYARLARSQGVDLPGWRLEDAFARVRARAEPVDYEDASPAQRRERERHGWRAVVRSTYLATDSTVQIPDPDALFEALWVHFARGDAWTVAPGGRESLAALRAQGRLLGVASNFDHRLLKILHDCELIDFFESVTIPSECGFRKPDPHFFAAAARALGTPPAETLHVGDDPETDLAGARRAGLAALQVCFTGAPDDESWPALPARVEALATLDDRRAQPDTAPGDGSNP